MHVELIPAIMGVLGTSFRKLKKHLMRIGIETIIVDLQNMPSFTLKGFSEKL